MRLNRHNRDTGTERRMTCSRAMRNAKKKLDQVFLPSQKCLGCACAWSALQVQADLDDGREAVV